MSKEIEGLLDELDDTIDYYSDGGVEKSHELKQQILAKVRELAAERDKLREASKLYWDLLQHIEVKTPGKTRHQAAVDILKARNECLNGAGSKEALKGREG